MAYREPQNPGLAGIDELTLAEESFIGSLVGLAYQTGDMLYYNGTQLDRLAVEFMVPLPSYLEYVLTGADITQVNIWTDSGKGTKLFTKDITYSGGNPTTIVMTNELTSAVITTTIAYSGSDISSITKVLT